MIRKIADEVYVEEYGYNLGYEEVKFLHECNEGEWMYPLVPRENESGPLYWCVECGKTVENGEAMAIRLYEAVY